MPSVYDWSATPASNTSVGGVNIAEGMSPALVNDAIRMALSIIRQTFDSSLQNFLNASAQLPIANGGTGAATAAAALTALGALSSAYQRLLLSARSAAFSPAIGESGTAYVYTGASSAAMTLQPNASVALTAGDTFIIRNGGGGALSVTPGSGVSLCKNGASSSSIAVLAVAGVASLVYWGGDFWTITGSGIS